MLLHSKVIGEGQPFIILHGFLGMGDNWRTLAKQFSVLGFELHLVDQRNHGRSFHDPEFNYDALASDLFYYCKHYSIKSCILLGHSMGGKTAMHFAALNPELVSKLIIADIAPKFYPVHHDLILEGLTSLDFKNIETRKKADLELSHYVQDFDTRQFLLKNIFWKSKGLLGLRINLSALRLNVSEVGEALSPSLSYAKETLFLRGDKSEYISLQDEALIKLQFPNSSIKSITNSGHWLHAENPIEFYENVCSFIT
ncbi:MAG: alpha/beta fold hydrolase [Flavobacteriaceae bacterium]|nr:alpha/beta fold hydrolase [Flavobacteriaceae bacterium]